MAGASLSSLLDSVRQIGPVIRAGAADAEQERRLPDAVADAMRACGLYRMWRPQAFGGLELDPMTAFQVLEAVSRIDSAAGWNLQLSSAVDAFGAWFADEGAEEIFGEPESRFGGAFFPFRRAGGRRWRVPRYRTDAVHKRRSPSGLVHGSSARP
jgi:indole-3-acetate monooxygenase